AAGMSVLDDSRMLGAIRYKEIFKNLRDDRRPDEAGELELEVLKGGHELVRRKGGIHENAAYTFKAKWDFQGYLEIFDRKKVKRSNTQIPRDFPFPKLPRDIEAGVDLYNSEITALIHSPAFEAWDRLLEIIQKFDGVKDPRAKALVNDIQKFVLSKFNYPGQ